MTGTVLRPDPRVALFLGSLRAMGWPSIASRTPRQARADLRTLAATTGSWRPIGRVEDAVAHGADGADGSGHEVPVRVYRTCRRTASRPALVLYFHGGGFAIGDLFTADGVCRRIAAATDAVVVSVHYRRTPEHRLPAAHADAPWAPTPPAWSWPATPPAAASPRMSRSACTTTARSGPRCRC